MEVLGFVGAASSSNSDQSTEGTGFGGPSDRDAGVGTASATPRSDNHSAEDISGIVAGSRRGIDRSREAGGDKDP